LLRPDHLLVCHRSILHKLVMSNEIREEVKSVMTILRCHERDWDRLAKEEQSAEAGSMSLARGRADR
jgi:hypothetical protein